ncbi:MAG TPA: hypothetical protein VH595_02520 [Verrucomicrobiae bacterium]|jgi:hypothetical protein|nr:hypothetical protein [Verrucomicrobiae bacterium]
MNSNSSKDRRLSEMEEQAYAEIRQRFAEQMEESSAVHSAIQRLEQDLTKHTGNVLRQVVSRTAKPENLVETDDGQQWQRSVDLTDDCYLCYCTTGHRADFAVVERSSLVGTSEVLTRNRTALAALQDFAAVQRQTLRIWAEDMAAQISEYLTEKYPGQNMSRVVNGFMQTVHPDGNADPISRAEPRLRYFYLTVFHNACTILLFYTIWAF